MTGWAAHDVDDLTGLPLRRAFAERAAAAIAAARADDAVVSLLVIDVDHFKLVNDSYGHLQGDAVLRMVAATLRASLPTDAFVGRYAGDEFVALLPGLPVDAAVAAAQRLCVRVRALSCPRHDGAAGAVGVTLSIGVAAAPQHGDRLDTVFAAADRALYAAKRAGRDAVAAAGAGGDEPAHARPDLDRYVGRAPELRTLVRLLDAAVGGAPQLVAVCGEAGVGKTALVRRLAPEVRLRGGALVTGRSLEGDVRPPYAPWADVVGALHRHGLLPARPWAELPRLVHELAPAAEGAAPGNRYALLDEIATAVRLAAERAPLVLVLDDMQWADAGSWDALEYALANLDGSRVLVCLTLRSEDTHGSAAERRRRLSRDERFHELRIARLTSAEVQEWVHGTLHASREAHALAPFLYRHTEGNPLFLVQVMRTLLDEGALRHTADGWEFRAADELRLPAAVTDLTARRLARLSEPARRMLATAAAIGREFDVDLAVAAGAGSESELLAAIDEGVAAAVLEPAGDRRGDSYAFAHALLASAIRGAENPRRLRAAHARVARALEDRRPDAVAEIAAQYDAAGLPAAAYDYAMLAGSRAGAVYANDRAASLFATALRHAADEGQTVEARLQLLRAAELGGRYADAERQCDALLDQHALPAAQRLHVSRARERVRSLQGCPVPETLAACGTLLDLAGHLGLADERAALLVMVSLAHSRLGDVDAATRHAREAVAIAERLPSLPLLADAVNRLAVMRAAADPGEAVALYERALAIYVGLGDRYGEGRSHVNTGLVHLRAGDVAAAESAFRAAVLLARDAHTPEITGAALLNLGVIYTQSDRDGEAAQAFEEALQVARGSGVGLHQLVARYNLAHLARERGDHPAALAGYERVAADAAEMGHLEIELGAVAGEGLCAHALGRREVATARLARLTTALTARDGWWFQGRELAEALAVLVACDTAPDDAATRFDAGLARAGHDPYAAAWLVAACAATLADAGVGRHWPVVERWAAEAERRGYPRLARRLGGIAAARA